MPQTEHSDFSIPERRPVGPILSGALVAVLAMGLAAGTCFAIGVPLGAKKVAATRPPSTISAHTVSKQKARASKAKNGADRPAASRGSDGGASARPSHPATAETLVTRTKVTRQRLIVRGKGAIESMVQAGSPGLRRLTVSSVSHRVVSSVVVKASVPTVVVRRRATGGKLVALTFDDGPHPTQTLKVLSILKAENIKATFFMVGRMARYHPQAARAVARAGMLIGDHTENHASLPGMTQAQITREIARGQASIRSVTGVTTHWFRSPYGAASVETRRDAGLLGMRVVAWDVDANDWKNPAPKTISDYVVSHVHAGSIVLLHDGGGQNRTSTIEALPAIIRELKKQHYRFVTLDQL